MEHGLTGRGSELGLQAQPMCTSFTHCTAAGKTQQQLAPELSRPLQALDNLPTELNWQPSTHSSGFPSGHMSPGDFHKIKCPLPAPEVLCLLFLSCPNRARVGILEAGGST